MLEVLTLAVFFWLLFKGIGLALKLTWGAAKIFAGILMAIALPLLVLCLVFAGGILLLLPLALAGIAVGILKICV